MILTAIPSDAGKRLDSFLHERLPQFSRSRLQTWVKSGRVRVGGAAVRSSCLLRGVEAVDVEPAALPALQAAPEEMPIHVLYEDNDVIVVDKPAGMVVHAGAGHHSGTLVNALLHHFGKLSAVNGDERPGIVHRIDKETSGVLVVARTDEAHRSLAAQFEKREVEKVYLALAHGRTDNTVGRITTPITRDPTRRTRMTAKLGIGRTALTEYRRLEEIGKFTYLEVRIGTGRTHQIRVHLASIRHPIFGDFLYGAPRHIPGVPEINRFFLHAHRLRFKSPSTGEWIETESPLASELVQILDVLRTADEVSD